MEDLKRNGWGRFVVMVYARILLEIVRRERFEIQNRVTLDERCILPLLVGVLRKFDPLLPGPAIPYP